MMNRTERHTPLSHSAILASAGTGKTYALAHRYIGLLGRGVPPDRICALTFSRKAAAEIFESIVAALVRAAGDPEAAQIAGQAAGLPNLDPAAATKLLRSLVESLHRVRVGTLDSFMVSVARAFAAELGLPAEFTLMNNGSAEARALSENALDFLAAPAARLDPQIRRSFFDAFQKATYGRDERGVSETFYDMIEQALGLFRLIPDPNRWGNPSLIWPDRPDWLQGLQDDPDVIGKELDARLAGATLPDKLPRLLHEAVEHRPYRAWRKSFDETIARRLFDALPTLDEGVDLLFNRRTYTIPPELGTRIAALLRHLVRQEMVRAWTQTQGLGAVLFRFQNQIDAEIRRRGALTFNDIQFLLSPSNPSGAGRISRQPRTPDRLFIDYRLDAQLDHWLLDEFQDTSDLQWAALDNLADEIIQDPSGTRSFFMVGDTKQAIHAWRGGNARLFDTLTDRYRGRLQEEKRSVSFRSAEPVLAAVNRLFDDLSPFAFPEDAVHRWNRSWARHTSHADRSGCAAWLEPDGNAAEPGGLESMLTAAAGLIRELRPVPRRLSIALLLPTNRECTLAANRLRRLLATERIPIVNEGAAELTDTPVVAVMRALLRYAVHPGDTLAASLLRMSPLAAATREAGEGLPHLLLRQVQEEGYVALFRAWSARLETAMGAPLDPFSAQRFRELLALAAEADARGERNPDLLLDQIDHEPLREPPTNGAVRVMTIHQSKGLGFDVVLLPLTGDQDLTTTRQGGLVQGGTPENPWVLKMPRQTIVQADPTLRAAQERITAETLFSNLCVFYVAMTRAKQGLYLLTAYGRKTRTGPRALTEGIFLSRQWLETDRPEQIGGDAIAVGGVPCRRLFLEGNWDWARAIPESPTEKRLEQVCPNRFPTPVLDRPRLCRVEPSRNDAAPRVAEWLFRAESRGVLEFGSMIHELLAQVEWSDGADAEAVLKHWTPRRYYPADVRRDAISQFRLLLQSDDVRTSLARPPGHPTLWREMPFELVDGTDWISGIFDRVVVHRLPDNRPVRAEIMDFKSNRLASGAEMADTAKAYRHQLHVYRRALTRILGLPPERIAIRILFTRLGRLYDMTPGTA